MPYLPRLTTLLALAALAAIGALLFAGSRAAEASPARVLAGLPEAGLPLEDIGYYKRNRRTYYPDYAVTDYGKPYRSYSYRNYGNGHDEIRELQRLFPETNWPPSMRYNHY